MSELASATLIAPDDDQSMAYFWKIYKMGHSGGSVQAFHEWFESLCALQKSVPPCPWCGKTADLWVVAYDEDLKKANKYLIACENESCEVKPRQQNVHETPEEAIEKWQTNNHQ